MPDSIWSTELDTILNQARLLRNKDVRVGDRSVEILSPFPSPVDWRDVWIYQIMVDRFNNPIAQPRHSWNAKYDRFQGGTLDGVRQQLEYLQELGVGALWLSPIQKNCQYDPFTYHGYGIQDFLAIEPRFASNPAVAANNPQLVETELQNLIDEVHARGMYVIFDIVLNHTGDVFEYAGHGATAPLRDETYTIYWRDEQSRGRSDWTQPPANPPSDAAVRPLELLRNEFFRRQGKGAEARGDFETLKEMITDAREFSQARGLYHPVRDVLIRAHQYLIAKYDIDGFRIDTLKYIEPEFARIFANAIREFALSIGKKNFFTFGEVYDNEEKIAHFIRGCGICLR